MKVQLSQPVEDVGNERQIPTSLGLFQCQREVLTRHGVQAHIERRPTGEVVSASGRHVDGVMVASTCGADPLTHWLAGAGVPVVVKRTHPRPEPGPMWTWQTPTAPGSRCAG